MKHLASPEAYRVVRYEGDYNVTAHPAMNGKFAAIVLWGFYDESQVAFRRLNQPWDRMRPGERMEVLERLGLVDPTP